MNTTESSHAHRPKLQTDPCSHFFDCDEEMAEFFVFFLKWTQRPDEMLEDLDKLLYGEDSEKFKEQAARPRQGQLYIKKFAKFVMEMLLIRGTDNFLTYVSELLALIFTERPETLKSSETVRLEEILQYQTMEDLIKRLAERRVERLSYQGMRDLQKDLADKLGFELFPSPETLFRAVEIIEVRNLFVHNRGLVNRTFQMRTGDSSTNIGSPFNLNPHRLVSDLGFLAHSVVNIDGNAALKFDLSRTESKSPEVTSPVNLPTPGLSAQ